MNRTMSVSQLARYLKGVFDDEELLHDVTLTGEVTDISYSDKHTFLVLADGAFSVRCVHFASRDNIEKGAFVALTGSVAFYDKRNTVSFTYSRFSLQGVGDKNAALAALKEKLFKLGYFENRPQLPPYITDVVAVTSPDGAAIRDFIRVVHDKNPFVSIRVFPVKVQGEGAAVQMSDAIVRLQNERTDAIVLCRGGGSDEDLDSFNDERLATAVALSRIPVISAVGHEINYSLCDYCAGTRAGTPSIAGEIVNARASAVTDDLNYFSERLRTALLYRYSLATEKLARLGRATVMSVSGRVSGSLGKLESFSKRGIYAVRRRLDDRRSALAVNAERLKSALRMRYTAKRVKIDKLSALLSALDPHRIIKIGYAAVLRRDKRVMNVADLSTGDEIKLVFADGNAAARIIEIDNGMCKETV